MTDVKQKATFKAVANVNFSVSLAKYPQMKAYNKIAEERLKESSPSARLTDTANLRYIQQGQEIVFGDELLVDEEFGTVTQYPKELFDIYSKSMVELPCKMKGHVEKEFNAMISRLPQEEQVTMMAKKQNYVQRFDVKPMLELVK